MQSIGVADGGAYSNASATNADGSVVVGATDTVDGQRAARWTAADGVTVLGVLTGGSFSTATGVSADGTIVVGNSGSSEGQRAFVWRSAVDPTVPTDPTDPTDPGVIQDYANLLGSFPVLAAATDVALGQAGDWLAAALSNGCAVADQGRDQDQGRGCLSVSGLAAETDTDTDSAAQDKSGVLSAGVAVGDHLLAGLVAASRGETGGDILSEGARSGLGGTLT